MSLAPSPASAPLRTPSTVMRLDRLGASFPTRLSFMRRLIRAMIAERTAIRRPVWEIDPDGYGRAVYELELGGHTYALIAYSQALPDEERTDRVIAEAWDTTFALFDGSPTRADLDRLQAQVPRQEAGRMQPTELILSRANKSVRLFKHVTDRLSQGQQPDAEMIRRIGYLMRTTAVYGNGKFGIADRDRIADRPILNGPFAAEMLTVYLIRQFTHDLVEHIARAHGGPAATRLDPALKRHLGIGNATGLGMAPFLVNHPDLLHAWIAARETALARILAEATPDRAKLAALFTRARAHVDDWQVDDAVQSARIETLRRELASTTLPDTYAQLLEDAQAKSLEYQELCVALLLEAHPEHTDTLCETMGTAPIVPFSARQTVGQTLSRLRGSYPWALDKDLPQDRAWYVSEDKLEPRLGDRDVLDTGGQESPLGIAQQVQAYAAALTDADQDQPLAAFLIAQPEHRAIARRTQTLADCPYAEIQDNLLSTDVRPIDLLRAKLAVFGASKFDPKSDRWTRVTLFQGAPLAGEIAAGRAEEDWSFPVLS